MSTTQIAEGHPPADSDRTAMPASNESESVERQCAAGHFAQEDGARDGYGRWRHDEYGETRMIDVLRRQRGSPSRAVLESIVEDLRQFSGREQHDDITLIVACRMAPNAQA